MKSKARLLGEMLGGRWTYDGMGHWTCDDGVHYVARVHTGGYDVNGEPLTGHGYFLYKRGGAFQGRIYFKGNKAQMWR